MRNAKLTLLEGWRRSPTWLRTALAAFVTFNTLCVVMVASRLTIPIGYKMALFSLAMAVQAALVGTVTDIYAAPEAERAQRIRSLAIGLTLLALVLLFFGATIVRLGGNVANRAM